MDTHPGNSVSAETVRGELLWLTPPHVNPIESGVIAEIRRPVPTMSKSNQRFALRERSVSRGLDVEKWAGTSHKERLSGFGVGGGL